MYAGNDLLTAEELKKAKDYLKNLAKDIETAKNSAIFDFKLNNLVEEFAPDPDDFEDTIEFLELELLFSEEEAEKIIDDFEQIWNGEGCKHSAFKYLGNGKKVIFAGDTTWGDSPLGFAYETLERLSKTGVLEEIGLE